jgi:hypothetical protein
MKKVIALVGLCSILAGCGWFGNDEVSDETSMFVDNGEIAVWYTDADYDISLRLPDEMDGYESEVEELDGENSYGTVEVVTFVVGGGPVASLNVHERSKIKANLDNLVYVERSPESEYVYTFTSFLSSDSGLGGELLDMAFGLGDYFTFE